MSDNKSHKRPARDPCRIAMGVLFVFSYLSTIFLGPLSAVNDSMTAAPEPIISCAIFGLSLLFFPRREKTVREGIYPGLFKRYFATIFDIFIAAFLVSSFLFPILLITENSAREEWVWSWETAMSPFYVPVLILSILFCFVGIYCYFRIHLERDRATPGQYMMGYKVIPTGDPDYNRRIWSGGRYFCLWFLAWTAETETEGVYTWDKNSNSQAVCVA